MISIQKALYNIRLLDEMAEKKTLMSKIHPVAKLITTFAFIIAVVSFSKYTVVGLIPYVLFPLYIIISGDIEVKPLINRVLIASPFVLGVGLFNPLLDPNILVISSNLSISAGWISLLSILIKCLLTLMAALLLVATTPMIQIGASMEYIRIPNIFVVQFLLTYRYITVFIEEILRTTRAYSIRSPLSKGIDIKLTGSLIGQILLRSIDRANRIYQAMKCRGFDGSYTLNKLGSFKKNDIVYTSIWLLFFLFARLFNIVFILVSWITTLVSGVIL